MPAAEHRSDRCAISLHILVLEAFLYVSTFCGQFTLNQCGTWPIGIWISVFCLGNLCTKRFICVAILWQLWRACTRHDSQRTSLIDVREGMNTSDKNLLIQLYIFGGHDANGTYLATGESWGVLTNSTNSTASMPAARSHYGAAAINNQTVYIVGGYASEANETSNTPERCNYVYNVTANSWSTGACLNQSRGALCSWDTRPNIFFVSFNLLVLFSLSSPWNSSLLTSHTCHPSSDAQLIVDIAWHLNLESTHHGTARMKLLLHGRYICKHSLSTFFLCSHTICILWRIMQISLFKPSLACEKSSGMMPWYSMSLMNSDLQSLQSNPTALLCRAVVNGKIFAVGGIGARGAQLDSIEVYNPSNNSWSNFAKLPSGRSGVGCAASQNNLIVAGGEAYDSHITFFLFSIFYFSFEVFRCAWSSEFVFWLTPGWSSL